MPSPTATTRSCSRSGRRCSIWSSRTSKAAGIRFVRLDGSTLDRGAVVNEFQADDGPPVMLLSLKAGGTGLNLTAADHVFLLDPWWNPAVEDQAADRAHRIGQDKPVMVYRMVARDTVEERILELQARKRALADAALVGGRRRARRSRATICSRCCRSVGVSSGSASNPRPRVPEGLEPRNRQSRKARGPRERTRARAT